MFCLTSLRRHSQRFAGFSETRKMLKCLLRLRTNKGKRFIIWFPSLFAFLIFTFNDLFGFYIILHILAPQSNKSSTWFLGYAPLSFCATHVVGSPKSNQ